MQSKRQNEIYRCHLFLTALMLFVSLILFAERARAQTTTDDAYRDATFSCLKKITKNYTWNPDTDHWVDIKTGKAVSSSVVGEGLTSVKKQINDPDRAFDSQTGQNLFWDAKTKTWKDAKTGESVTSTNPRDALFCCLTKLDYTWNPHTDRWVDIKTGKAVSSSVVGEALTSVKKDSSDPDRAFNSKTGQNFAWDSHKQAWIDVKTGECICPKCPAGAANTTPPSSTPTPSPSPNPTPSHASSEQDYERALEFFAGYQYMRAPDESAKSLNGFDASLFYNFTPHVALGGDFSGAFGSDKSGTVDISLHRFTYLFGPQFNLFPNDKVKIFVHPLIGGVHDTTKSSFGTSSDSFSASAFAMAFGGGVDVRVSPRVSVRVFQADYLPTHFGGAWQNNFRISTGVVFKFGGNK